MKTKTCKNCKFENEAMTRYCQGCGDYLKTSITLKNLFADPFSVGSQIGGIGTKGVSMAPLAVLSIKKHIDNKELSAFQTKARVIACPDGSWFCPDCGVHNKPEVKVCPACEKYK